MHLFPITINKYNPVYDLREFHIKCQKQKQELFVEKQ